MDDLEHMRKQLATLGYTEQVTEGDKRIILSAACRIDPEPQDQTFIDNLDAYTCTPDATVRTRLVFGEDRSLIFDESSFNVPLASESAGK